MVTSQTCVNTYTYTPFYFSLPWGTIRYDAHRNIPAASELIQIQTQEFPNTEPRSSISIPRVSAFIQSKDMAAAFWLLDVLAFVSLMLHACGFLWRGGQSLGQ